MFTKSTKFFLIAGAISGFFAVAAGAFGAHGLRNSLAPESMQIWQTAVLYQAIHALALLFTGLAAGWKPELKLAAAGWSFFGGSAIFSGSLYTLALSGVKWLGAITPIGGVLFLVGWALLAWKFWRMR